MTWHASIRETSQSPGLGQSLIARQQREREVGAGEFEFHGHCLVTGCDVSSGLFLSFGFGQMDIHDGGVAEDIFGGGGDR